MFYVWSAEEIDALLGTASPAFKAAYDVRPGGNWEGRNVLRRVTPPGEGRGTAPARFARPSVRARAKRTPPPLDDKILADWNGLTIAALARAAAVFEAPGISRRGPRGLRFRLEQSSRRRRPHCSFLARGQGRRGGPARRLRRARARRARPVRDHRASPAIFRPPRAPREAQSLFGAPDGGLYLTAEDAADAPRVRPRIANDGATPSGVGLMAEVFARLFHLTDDSAWREAAERLIRAFTGVSPQELAQSPLLLAAADLLERGGCVVIEGALDHPIAIALAQAALAAPDPAMTVLRLDRSLWPQGPPGGRPPPPAFPRRCCAGARPAGCRCAMPRR